MGARTSCWNRVRLVAGEEVGVLAGRDVVVAGWALSSMLLAMMLPRGLSGVGAEVTVLARRAARATMLVEVYIMILNYWNERRKEIVG